MRNVLALAAIAASLSFAGSALAQTPPAAKPTAPTTGAPASSQPSDATPSAAPTSSTPTTSSAAAPPPSAGASGSNAAANAGAGASLTSGMSVKDNTGAIIGEVKSLKGGLATIQMGNDSFTVDANKLGVSAGAATINATQAELKSMLAGAKK